MEREESRGVFDAIVVVPSVCSLRNVERGLGRRKAPSETWREIVGMLSPIIVADVDAPSESWREGMVVSIRELAVVEKLLVVGH